MPVRFVIWGMGLLAPMILISGCSKERSMGAYYERASLEAPRALDERWGVQHGAGFVVSVTHTSRPFIEIVSESMQQTDLLVELSTRPADGERVDLSKARVAYHQGGQVVTYTSSKCRGELVLESRGADTVATVDVTCNTPSHGSGEQRFQGKVPITRSTP